MYNIKLRQSTESDRAFVDNLTRRTMRTYVEKTWSRTEDIEHYYSINKFNQQNTKIVQCNDEDIGRITVSHSHGTMLLEAIHIREDFQGKGIGEHLIKQATREAKERQFSLELILLKVNPAIKLYERTGFCVHKEDDNRYYMRMAL